MKAFRLIKDGKNESIWPFTVNSVRIEKDKKNPGIYVKCNGERYGLNGIAVNCKKLEEIWLDNPEIPGTKKSISFVFVICRKKGLL